MVEVQEKGLQVSWRGWFSVFVDDRTTPTTECWRYCYDITVVAFRLMQKVQQRGELEDLVSEWGIQTGAGTEKAKKKRRENGFRMENKY